MWVSPDTLIETTAHTQPDTAAFSNTSLHLLLCAMASGEQNTRLAVRRAPSVARNFWYNVSGSRGDDKYLNTFTPEIHNLRWSRNQGCLDHPYLPANKLAICQQTQRGGSESKCPSRNQLVGSQRRPSLHKLSLWCSKLY